MSNRQGWIEQFRKLPNWTMGAIGLITAIIGLINLILGNFYVGVTVIVGVILIALFGLSLGVVFSKKDLELTYIRRGVEVTETRRKYRHSNNYRYLAIAGLFLIPVIVFILLFIQPSRDFIVAALREITTSIPTPVPTSTTTLSADEVLSIAKSWPVDHSASFDNKESGWRVGNFDNENRLLDKKLINGTYVWTMKILTDNSFHYNPPPLEPVSDFYLSVKIRRVDENENKATYGLIFRREGSNFYNFAVTDDRDFSMRRQLDDEWTDLIGWTITQFRTDDFNKLTVVADGSHIYLYVNDRCVGDVEDDEVKGGNVATMLALYDAGDEAEVEFREFELRRKPP